MYLHHLCVDTGCSIEELPGAVDDKDEREGERERESQRDLMAITYVSISGYYHYRINVYVNISLYKLRYFSPNNIPVSIRDPSID